VRRVSAIESRAIPTKAIRQAAGDAPDGGDADASKVVDLSVGEVLFEVFNDLPTVEEGLELGWSAEVLEEITAFIDAFQADNGLEERVFGACLLAFGVVSVRFHLCSNAVSVY